VLVSVLDVGVDPCFFRESRITALQSNSLMNVGSASVLHIVLLLGPTYADAHVGEHV